MMHDEATISVSHTEKNIILLNTDKNTTSDTRLVPSSSSQHLNRDIVSAASFKLDANEFVVDISDSEEELIADEEDIMNDWYSESDSVVDIPTVAGDPESGTFSQMTYDDVILVE